MSIWGHSRLPTPFNVHLNPTCVIMVLGIKIFIKEYVEPNLVSLDLKRHKVSSCWIDWHEMFHISYGVDKGLYLFC